MGVIDQLPAARQISARQLDGAIDYCERRLERSGSRTDLKSVAMLCHWWRGERARSYQLAEKVLVESPEINRAAVEVAASYCADRPEVSGTVESIRRLADLSSVTGLGLILANPAWFARSISQDRSLRADRRVRRAVDEFAAARRQHVEWANHWLEAREQGRTPDSAPPI